MFAGSASACSGNATSAALVNIARAQAGCTGFRAFTAQPYDLAERVGRVISWKDAQAAQLQPQRTTVAQYHSQPAVGSATYT